MDPRPPAPELLEAVSAWLLDEVVPALADDRGRAFRARIAANLVAVAAREVRDGAAVSAAEHADQCALLGVDPDEMPPAEAAAALAVQLRDTPSDDPLARRARAVLVRHLEARIALSNPRFRLGDDVELPERETPA
ncbi:MAG: hypothetical protein EA398_02560 [Deltaproteobacteria bacterium]|nr:MAG: hypothetical protein EA398_02560 [Deltaproteobacteria bacterium]